MSTAVTTPKKISPDARQLDAIEHLSGPMVVIAGAGTGKTTVLIQRIARLIREGHARPDEILALTYTENAAAEMQSRVRRELDGVNIAGLRACTFHYWCLDLLQRHGRGFNVLDDKELWVYLRRRIRELKLKYFVRAANVSQFFDDLLDFMRRCQDELVGPEEYAGYVALLEQGKIPLPRVAKSKKQAELDDAEILDRCREIARAFATVEGMLGEKNLGTFGHMITGAHDLLKNNPAVLELERKKIKFLLVDEFQDANFAQVEILAMLAGAEANIFIVGDPDQAIYQFRGASSEAFMLFVRHFPQAKMVALEKNRRSLSPILQCAFGIVNENPAVFADKGSAIRYQRSPLESWRESVPNENGSLCAKGGAVEIVIWGDRDVEAADIARRIQRKRKELRCEWRRFAVLYRQHIHREELVQELAERGIPFSIEGLDVLNTPEVRDVLACMSAAVNPRDAANLFRVAALPQYCINPRELKAAMRAVKRDELDLPKVMEKLPGGAAVLADIEKARVEVEREETTAQNTAKLVIRQFALRRNPAVNTFVEFIERWQKNVTTETGRTPEFLEYLGYFRQAKGSSIAMPPNKEDGVRLMSVHAAKGLEFGHVAILRGSSTSFPCAYREPLVEFPQELRRSPSTVDDKTLHEQEERRLYYVAMTRAEDSLTILAKEGAGKTDKRPGKFLREFIGDPRFKKFWQMHSAAAVQDQLFAAEEEERVAIERSNVAAWLLGDTTGDFVKGLSASAIDTYQQCPLRFKLERDWNLPRDVPAALHYGAAMHRVLLTFYQAQQMGREIANEQLLENFREDLAAAGIADRYQYELYLRQGKEQLTQFIEWARAGVPAEVLETERKFDVMIEGTRVSGRVDRVDRVGTDGVAIVDYKTGKPKTQKDADESLQLSLYALAAQEAWGMRADRLVFHNLEDNTAVVTTRDRRTLDAAKAQVRETAEDIAAGNFTAKPGYHCSFCPYRNLCPATEKTIAFAQKARRAN
ncbi:MAG TPA: ATP-dependent DNA helicase [Terriglobales bacterium]|nr:ATP-dependent DNA helicase [Terriglobales bacterium]